MKPPEPPTFHSVPQVSVLAVFEMHHLLKVRSAQVAHCFHQLVPDNWSEQSCRVDYSIGKATGHSNCDAGDEIPGVVAHLLARHEPKAVRPELAMVDIAAMAA